MTTTGVRAAMVVGAIALVVACAGAAAVYFRVAIAQHLVQGYLASARLGPETARIAAVEIDHLVVADLEFPAFGATIQRVRADFVAGELLDRHIRRLHIEGLAVETDLDRGLPSIPAAGEPGDGMPWTIGTISLDRATLIARADDVSAEVSLAGEATHLNDSRYAGAVDFGARVSVPGHELVPLAGRAEFRAGSEGIERATVEMVADALPIPLIDAQNARLSGTLSRDGVSLRASVTMPEGRIELAFDGPLPQSPDPAAVTGVLLVSAENPPLPVLDVRTVQAEARLGDETMTVTGTVTANEGAVDFTAEAPKPADFGSTPGSLRAGVAFRLDDVEVPGVTGSVAATGRLGLALDGTAAEVRVREDMSATIDVGGERIAASIPARAVSRVRTENLLDGRSALEVRIGEAALEAYGTTLSLLGVDAEVRRGPMPAVTVRAARLDAGRPDLVPPVDLDGRGVLDGDTLRFEARARTIGGVVAAEVRGRHDLESSAGEAEIALGPVHFIPGLLQPGDLTGAAPPAITDVRGGVGVSGTLAWQDGGLDPDFLMKLDDLGFAAAGARIQGINGSVAFDRIWPPRTPLDQVLGIDEVVAGVPMANGVVRFRIDDAGRLSVADAGLDLLGGRVSVDDLVVDPAAERHTATVRIERVGVQRLIDLAELDGTFGTGVVAGEIPVAVTAAGISGSGGRVEATDPGVLRYDPPVPPVALQGGGEGVSLMLSALKNFHYEVLSADIDGEAGGGWLAALHLTGNNPDFMDGYPFELNFNLSGRLDAILRDGIKGFSLPERIGEGLSDNAP